MEIKEWIVEYSIENLTWRSVNLYELFVFNNFQAHFFYIEKSKFFANSF